MDEEIKLKAKESAETHGYGLGCTVSQTECYVEGYITGATEETKELVEENKTAKKIIKGLLIILHETANDEYDFEKACPYQYEEAKQFVKD